MRVKKFIYRLDTITWAIGLGLTTLLVAAVWLPAILVISCFEQPLRKYECWLSDESKSGF